MLYLGDTSEMVPGDMEIYGVVMLWWTNQFVVYSEKLKGAKHRMHTGDLKLALLRRHHNLKRNC